MPPTTRRRCTCSDRDVHGYPAGCWHDYLDEDDPPGTPQAPPPRPLRPTVDEEVDR